jgi:hypothetical protein
VGAIIIAIILILILILGVASTATGQTPDVSVTPNPDAGPSTVWIFRPVDFIPRTRPAEL